MHRCAALLLACLPLGSCAIEQPPVPMHQFVHGDLQPVADFARERLQTGPVENRALVLDVLAQCELMQGDTEAAWRDFFAAARIMGNWQVSGGEEVAAIVGSEGSKTYKGDPYEKAMNAFYLGMCFLWRGEPDNARAAFKKGILADAESSDEKYQADFTLLFWLAGRMSRLMGLSQEAVDFYGEARKADEFSRDASVLAVLALAAQVDTHEVKSGKPEDIAEWKKFAKEFQEQMTTASAAFKKADATAAGEAWKKGNASCNDCHAKYRPNAE